MRALRLEVQVASPMDADQLAALVESVSTLLATHTRVRIAGRGSRVRRRKTGGRP